MADGQRRGAGEGGEVAGCEAVGGWSRRGLGFVGSVGEQESIGGGEGAFMSERLTNAAINGEPGSLPTG
jgi:hypothetical protein